MSEPLHFRILISYWFFKDDDVGAIVRNLQALSGMKKLDVFADSGAFTAFTKGVHIDIAEYAAWIRKWEKYLTVYLNLDVIGDQAGTSANQAKLEAMGLHPVPVYTFQRAGCDYSILAEMIERYPYIALGGMVPFMGRPKAIMPHIIKCFKMAGDRTVYHGLGCTSWHILKAIPFYSVDSSSWTSGARWRTVNAFDEIKGKWVRGDWKRHHDGSKRNHKGMRAAFSKCGFDIEEVAAHDYGYALMAIAGLSYVYAERYLRKRHGKVLMPRAEATSESLGLRLYLATLQEFLFEIVASAFGNLHTDNEGEAPINNS